MNALAAAAVSNGIFAAVDVIIFSVSFHAMPSANYLLSSSYAAIEPFT